MALPPAVRPRAHAHLLDAYRADRLPTWIGLALGAVLAGAIYLAQPGPGQRVFPPVSIAMSVIALAWILGRIAHQTGLAPALRAALAAPTLTPGPGAARFLPAAARLAPAVAWWLSVLIATSITVMLTLVGVRTDTSFTGEVAALWAGILVILLSTVLTCASQRLSTRTGPDLSTTEAGIWDNILRARDLTELAWMQALLTFLYSLSAAIYISERISGLTSAATVLVNATQLTLLGLFLAIGAILAVLVAKSYSRAARLRIATEHWRPEPNLDSVRLAPGATGPLHS